MFDASKLREPETVDAIKALKPEIGITAFFAYILKPDIIEIPLLGCINLHPAMLPHNQGWHPNVWPILDGSPAGVTVHYIDEGVDTGDIIAQRVVEVEPTDTGGSLHQRLTRELVSLFQDTWPAIKAGTNQRIQQGIRKGTSHRRRDMDAIDKIDLDETYVAKDLINILRGRTYPPYPAAYFIHDGRRVYVRVQLISEENLDSSDQSPSWD